MSETPYTLFLDSDMFIKDNNFLNNILNEVANVTGPVRYTTKFGGYDWSVKFDVNKNPTKVGVKMQFIPKDGSQLDGAKLNDVGNKLATFLQKKFSNYDIIIDRDKDLKDKFTAIGFIIPSGANFLASQKDLL